MKVLPADDAQDSDAPHECREPEAPIVVTVAYMASARLVKVF
jgi:hypothetical protein